MLTSLTSNFVRQVMDLSSIFLGVTSGNRARFLSGLFTQLLKKYPKMVVPCVGTFKVAGIGVHAGYKPEDIYTSDIALFTALLDAYINDKDVDNLPLNVSPKYNLEEYKGNEIPYLLVLIKKLQLDESVEYEKMYINEIWGRKEVYIKKVEEKLEELKTLVGGVEYKAEDLRDTIYEVWAKQKNTVLVVDPPMYSKGYTKMFDFGEELKYDIQFREFDVKTHYEEMFSRIDEIGKKNNSPAFMFYNKIIPEYEDSIVFAEEKSGGKVTYIYAIGDVKGIKKMVAVKPVKELKPIDKPLFTDDDEITKESQVQMIKVPVDVALYYRDLFAHKLGSTQADLNYLMLIDGKIHSVVGFNTGDVLKLRTGFIWEMYGFSVGLKKYYTNNRILMSCISSVPMKNQLMADMTSGRNRYFNLRGMRTTCETPYRVHKSNQGILQLVEREKKPNGFYRLVFEQFFQKKSYNECVVEYLEWLEARKKRREELRKKRAKSK